MECVATNVNAAARTVTLRSHRKAVSAAVIRSGSLSFNALVPGMLFNVLVDSIMEVLHLYTRF